MRSVSFNRLLGGATEEARSWVADLGRREMLKPGQLSYSAAIPELPVLYPEDWGLDSTLPLLVLATLDGGSPGLCGMNEEQSEQCPSDTATDAKKRGLRKRHPPK